MAFDLLLGVQQSLWPGTVKDWAELCAYVATILAALFAVPSYLRNSRRDRTKWLHDLYDRFYGNSDLREVRVKVDDGDTEFARNETDLGLMGKLDDYLNFFEFVALLEARGELSLSEINEMFDYPLRKIASDENLRVHIARQDYGYERLPKLLKKMGYWTV